MTYPKAATIRVSWNPRGRLKHTLKVNEFSKNPFLWLFAPSAPMLITHQLGAMKPSHGLHLCSKILGIIGTGKYVASPINSALKGVQINLVYVQQETVMLQYVPKHAFFHNDHSLEEGTRQFVANYYSYVLSKLQEYGKIAAKSFTIVGINGYLEFLEQHLQSGFSNIGQDKWSQDFIMNSQSINFAISTNFIAPDEWSENEHKKNET